MSAKPYSFYPIAWDSDDDEEPREQPGGLFRRFQRNKRFKYSSSSDVAPSTTTATTTATTTTTTTTTTAITTSQSTAPSTAENSGAQAPPPLPTYGRWCNCGNCQDMPTSLERKCCTEECFDLTNFQDANFTPGSQCVLQSHLLVDQIFSAASLQLQWFRQRRYQGFRGNDLLFCHMTNLHYRYFAYRSYIDFLHGYLGRHNRRVIPACVVAYIRATWPDPDNKYVGFREVQMPADDDDDDQPVVPRDELYDILEDVS